MQCVFKSLYHYHTAQSACADDQTVFLNFTFMYTSSSLLKYFEMTVIVIWDVAISYQYNYMVCHACRTCTDIIHASYYGA